MTYPKSVTAPTSVAPATQHQTPLILEIATKRFLAVSAFLLSSATAQAQVNINFDGTSAPCGLSQATSLTSLYASQGATFSGGGSILNQCSNFDVGAAHSGTDFLAFYNSGGAVQFSSAQRSFSIWVGSTSAYTFAFFLGATPVTTLSATSLSAAVWTPVVTSAVFDRVTFDAGGGTMTLDDLVTSRASTVPEPSSIILMAAGLAGVAIVRRRRTTQQG